MHASVSLISALQRNAIWSLTSCAENSRTDFEYDYAENIGDGRGITFGIVGFTSGTYDGTMLLERIAELEPGNALVRFLPAFRAIDAGPHDSDGCSADVKGLEGFIAAFQAHGRDAAVRKAQLEKLSELYWEPALAYARELGIRRALVVGELYDACVNHGERGGGTAKGMHDLGREANARAGGTPGTGVDEARWLKAFLDAREAYMRADPTWAESLDRLAMYRRILASGNLDLVVPFRASCYGDTFTITGAAP